MYLGEDAVKPEVDISKLTNYRAHAGIRVDYWIPSLNLVVEVHGIQHYKASGFGANKIEAARRLAMQSNRDGRLRRLCEQYGINYVEIPYDDKVNALYVFQLLAPYRDQE